MLRWPTRGTVPVQFALGLALGVAAGPGIAAADRTLVAGGAAALDRMAFAVDGAESSHGADPGMWRDDANGPQGPMQVTAAAAADAGGGDRFDEKQNRALGRAYLALMLRRYGSWPDAVAAYNWGPGRLDRWIGGGRPISQLPSSVARYQARVLSEAGLRPAPAMADGAFGGIIGRLARLRLLRLEAKRQLADRHRPGHAPDVVELLYADIMRTTSRPVE